MSDTAENERAGDSRQEAGVWGRFRSRWGRWRERWWFRWGFDLVVLAGLLYGVMWWQTRHLRADGEQLPAVELASVDGEARPLWDKDGKTTLLYVWAPWCGVCSAESGTVSWAKGWVGGDVEVRSVVLDWRNRREVESYVEENGVDYPVFYGDDRIRRALNVQSFPTFYILSDDGRVRSTSVGYTTTLGLLFRSWWS